MTLLAVIQRCQIRIYYYNYSCKNKQIDLTTEWLLQLQGADGSRHSYMYIAGITRYLEFLCVASYKGNSTTLLFLELHTLASDQLITRCSLTNYFLSDNLTAARMLASIATYFQLGKMFTHKLLPFR